MANTIRGHVVCDDIPDISANLQISQNGIDECAACLPDKHSRAKMSRSVKEVERGTAMGIRWLETVGGLWNNAN